MASPSIYDLASRIRSAFRSRQELLEDKQELNGRHDRETETDWNRAQYELALSIYTDEADRFASIGLELQKELLERLSNW